MVRYVHELPGSGWRLYAMNSNCAEPKARVMRGQCAPRSDQVQWLRQQMEAHKEDEPGRCTLMYMHHPLWASSVEKHDRQSVRNILAPLYRAFLEEGGDVVLAGHAHHYERFALSALNRRAGARPPRGARGFRLFVVGTGGFDLRGVSRRREPRSERANDENFGVLRLCLGDAGYRWNFDVSLTVPGGDRLTEESGFDPCR